MAGITIGRAGVDSALVVDEWATAGPDEVTVTGWIRDQGSLAAVQNARRQVLGLADNTDEPVVPVVWSDGDSSQDGFYRVMGSAVSSEPRTRLDADSVLAWQVDLRRVHGWQAPLFEIIVRGADRAGCAGTNWSWVGAPSDGVTNAVNFYALTDPGGASGSDIESAETNGGDTTAKFYFGDTDVKDDLYDTEMVYQVNPGDYYANAARIETSPDSGTTWDTVVGRQVSNTPLYWRLYNSVLRVTQGSDSRIDVEHWDSVAAGWKAAKTYQLANGAKDSLFGDPESLTILRNSPEMVSIRLWYSSSTTQQDARYVDLTLYRGSWILHGVMVMAESAQTEDFGVFRDSVEAAVAVTDGADASSADGDGDKYQLRSASTSTADTTNGGLTLDTAADFFDFGIACDINEETPGTTGAYAGAMSHRQQVAAR